MSPLTWKLSYSLILCLFCYLASAQEAEKTDSVQVKALDTTKMKAYPRALRIGTDIISIIKSHTQNSFTGWELNGDVDFGKFYLSADYGKWSHSYDLQNGLNGNYTNDGTYWRVGADVNLLKKDPDRNMFFMGFRYGHSKFNESATVIETADPHFGDISKQLSNTGLKAGWGELVTGLRVKMWNQFWMGYTARMKFAPSVKGGGELKTYDIPGYGLYQYGIYWGFNYQIFWNIPFKKEKKPAAAAPK
jgi:hypothetical protein